MATTLQLGEKTPSPQRTLTSEELRQALVICGDPLQRPSGAIQGAWTGGSRAPCFNGAVGQKFDHEVHE